MQGAHGFSCRYMGTRWDVMNLFCLCAGCHLYFTKRPVEWEHWMQMRLGLPIYLALQAKALHVTKLTREDLELRLAELTRPGGF